MRYVVEIHCCVELDAASEDEAIEEALNLDTYDLIWDAEVIDQY